MVFQSFDEDIVCKCLYVYEYMLVSNAVCNIISIYSWRSKHFCVFLVDIVYLKSFILYHLCFILQYYDLMKFHNCLFTLNFRLKVCAASYLSSFEICTKCWQEEKSFVIRYRCSKRSCLNTVKFYYLNYYFCYY